jgi:hypothetical protein
VRQRAPGIERRAPIERTDRGGLGDRRNADGNTAVVISALDVAEASTPSLRAGPVRSQDLGAHAGARARLAAVRPGTTVVRGGATGDARRSSVARWRAFHPA